MLDHRIAELHSEVSRWGERGLPRPKAVLVTGSGASVDLGTPTHGPFPMTELLPFGVEAVEGHALTYELLEPQPGLPLLYFRGRVHAYQGFSAADVVFVLRLGALLGAELLVLTNACGSLRPEWQAGSLALITDHLNLTGLNPLCGVLPPAWGPRFPDLSEAYDADLRELAGNQARRLGLTLGEGVYCGLLGPSYETPAEIRMLDRLGADLVGMSTVLEVIAARQMGLRCLGLSLVANPAAGMAEGSLDHQEVLAVGRRAAVDLEGLLRALLGDPELVRSLATR